jgi:hypothetical protein
MSENNTSPPNFANSRIPPILLIRVGSILFVGLMIGCCISLRFFYIPPTAFFAVLCVVLLAATVQLLKGEK